MFNASIAEKESSFANCSFSFTIFFFICLNEYTNELACMCKGISVCFCEKMSLTCLVATPNSYLVESLAVAPPGKCGRGGAARRPARELCVAPLLQRPDLLLQLVPRGVQDEWGARGHCGGGGGDGEGEKLHDLLFSPKRYYS